MVDTALVTGASSGLGELFARKLAARGHNLILVARRANRLVALADELTKAHGIAAHVIAADLAQADAVVRLMDEIASKGLAVNILINNAGFGARGGVITLDVETQLRMIDVNCRALVALTRAVLPGMVQLQRGSILNIASTAAFQPGPWMAVYYASKAFVLSFSEAVHEEVKGRGVRVACLCPGATRTEFAVEADMESSRLFRMLAGDADKVVADGLAALDANRAVKVSGLVHGAMAASVRFTPRFLARAIAGAMQKPN